ncbi:NADPH:quinone reductase [Linnemannia schmuckeri]|uniref:NADPH:quinone reductase n=1 Tax=Linnemannia schmuckeri TaxID=64567 RepID=A0A9P5RTF5_9FUNG|nr:NADPH:quinone reductase [Linnemannia schmuckeri]
MVNATSRAIRVETRGPASVLTSATIPRPTPKPTQVLVQVAFAGINFIDIAERTGAFPIPTSVPFIPGREGAGEIVEVGAEVQHGFKVGDRVAFLGFATYAEYVAVDTVNLAKLPDSVSYEDGAALMIQGLTALSVATRSYSIQKDDIVVIHAAAGGVGLILSQIASRLGATVIGTASTPEKAAVAKLNGTHHVVIIPSIPTPGTKNPYEPLETLVASLTNGRGVHAVFDSVGKATFESDLVIARRNSTIVIYGAASGPIPDFNIGRLTAKNLKLTRVSLYNYMTTFEEFDELFKEGLELLKGESKIKLEVSKVYEFEDIQQAHLDLEGRKSTGKLLLKVAGNK